MSEYVILTHPMAGRWRRRPQGDVRSRALEYLAPAREVLRCDVVGLETACREEFVALARANSDKVIVVATGDGGFGDVAQEVPAGTRLAYLPGGSGCAMGYVAGYDRLAHLGAGGVEEMACRIRDGRDYPLDLICTGDRKGMFASVGFEAEVLCARGAYPCDRLLSYCTAGARSLRSHRPAPARVGPYWGPVSSVMLTTVPFMGFGGRLAPDEVLGSGRFAYRVLASTREVLEFYVHAFAAPALLAQEYATDLTVVSDRPLPLQLNGDALPERKVHRFSIEPAAVLLRC